MSAEQGSPDYLIKEQIREIQGSLRICADEATSKVKGRRVRIITNFHDQPYGRSKPNLKGKEFTVHSAWMNEYAIGLCLEGVDCTVDIDYVEFI